MNTQQTKAIFFAILAAAFYAVSAPLSKLLLVRIPPTLMASYLYLGAGTGLFLISGVQKALKKEQTELPLTRNELPYTIGMIVLDIAAPVLLMIGLTKTTAANASLLNNFEIAATSLIALLIFREQITRRLWLAIGLVTAASVILSFENAGSLSFSAGSFFVLLACVCWGLENNCTRMLSSKNPAQIVIIKGFGSGIGAFLLAQLAKEQCTDIRLILTALLLGFVSYGLSILFYIYAQRFLGAAKTSAYYAFAPFIGAGLSLLLFREKPSVSFLAALLLMLIGAYLASRDGG